jgi:hypothetical protein
MVALEPSRSLSFWLAADPVRSRKVLFVSIVNFICVLCSLLPGARLCNRSISALFRGLSVGRPPLECINLAGILPNMKMLSCRPHAWPRRLRLRRAFFDLLRGHWLSHLPVFV